MQVYLNHAPGILDAEITGLSHDLLGEAIERSQYLPLPQISTVPEVPCTVTINYPSFISHSHLQDGFTSASLYHKTHLNNIYPPGDWSQLPVKLRPPSFYIDRCHHEGMMSSTNGETYELPLGFPEIVQYFHEARDDVELSICSWQFPSAYLVLSHEAFYQ